MVRNRIPSIFFFRKWFGTEFRSFLLWKWFGKEFQGFIIRIGLERNSKGFSLPRNGSERKSELFLVRETGGIPMELPSVSSSFVFRGIIFLLENGNPSNIHGTYSKTSDGASEMVDNLSRESTTWFSDHNCLKSSREAKSPAIQLRLAEQSNRIMGPSTQTVKLCIRQTKVIVQQTNR
jgi:hypothetical protein